jgi:hypothetical protein
MKLSVCTAATLAACSLLVVQPAAAQQPSDTPSPDDLANSDTGYLPEAAVADPMSTEADGSAMPEPLRAPNSVFAEGLGSGLMYSVNYERLVTEDLAARIGFGYLSVSASDGTTSASSSLFTIPLTVSYLGIGGKHHMLEVGGGATLLHTSGAAAAPGVSASATAITAFPELLLGYRLHPVDGAGFQLRVGAMAFAGKGLSLTQPDPTKFGVLPWFYLSVGASF